MNALEISHRTFYVTTWGHNIYKSAVKKLEEA